MKLQKIFSLAVLLLIAVSTSACDVTTPSRMNLSKIRVKNQMVTETFDANRLDSYKVSYTANSFSKNGKGKLSITVSYLEGDRVNRIRAEKNGKTYKNEFKKLGVDNISLVTVPVDNKDYADKVIVSYQSLVALAPKECSQMPGHNGAETLQDTGLYQFGCNTKMTISKMIVDPSDLLGKKYKPDVDSRRSAATVENYKSGTPNGSIGGFNASNIGTGN